MWNAYFYDVDRERDSKYGLDGRPLPVELDTLKRWERASKARSDLVRLVWYEPDLQIYADAGRGLRFVLFVKS